MFDMNRLSIKRTPLVESVTSLHSSYLTNDQMQHSFFSEACQFCSKMDREMLELNRSFYGSICESEGNRTLIHESFSDWVSSFKKLLKKVIDFLHALLNKFLVGINMLIKREGFIKDHKKDLLKFNENHKFHMNVFTFTFDNNVPEESAIYTSIENVYGFTDSHEWEGKADISTAKVKGLANDYTVAYGGSASIASADRAGYIDKEYQAFVDTLNEGDYYDYIRGRFLGYTKNERVDSTDYSKELFEKFRDGQSGKEDKEFEYKDIQEAYNRFDNYERIKKDLTKKKTNAEKAYRDIEKRIDKALTKGKDSNVTINGINSGQEFNAQTPGEVSKLEYYVKAVSNMVHEVSNLHSIAFSARLDAYKDQFAQDKTILYKALYRIMGSIRHGERKYSKKD